MEEFGILAEGRDGEELARVGERLGSVRIGEAEGECCDSVAGGEGESGKGLESSGGEVGAEGDEGARGGVNDDGGEVERCGAT